MAKKPVPLFENDIRIADKSSWHLPFQVVTVGPIVVIEGGATEHIEITMNFPPSFICRSDPKDNEPCFIHIEVEFASFVERQCWLGGDRVVDAVQAVIGWWSSGDSDTEMAFCGLAITDENWQEPLRIPIKAKMDMVVEENAAEIRYLSIFERHYVGMTLVYESWLSNIEASTMCNVYIVMQYNVMMSSAAM